MTDAEILRALFTEAVAVADPMRSMAQHLPPRPTGRVLVLGAGKASARMAEAVEAQWGPCEGLVITRYGYGRPCQGIEIVEAAHPVPDAAGEAATARMLALVESLTPQDHVLMLLSGGASALLVAPVAGVSLAEKQAFNAALLASGAPIGVMNALRKGLSRVKGGRLALACKAPLLCLMISDVAGDDMAVIGSGPTVGSAPTEPAEALLARWQIAASPAVARALREAPALPAPDDPHLKHVTNKIIAAPAQSLAAAAARARELGFEVEILGADLEGEAQQEAARQAALALARRRDLRKPLLLLSGGELTVTGANAGGIGGPNAEFCLALALALDGAAGITALACDTDGVDGAAEVAGAVITPESLAKARALGLDPEQALARHDAHNFFKALGAQVVTGPTLTNVNDFRAILLRP